MAIDQKKLTDLEKKASDALFDLHDYLRRADGENGYEWRRIYGYRADLGHLVFGLKARLKREAVSDAS